MPDPTTTPPMPAFRLLLLRSVLAASFAACDTGTAWAHAALVRSVPGNRDVLAHPPERLHLQFNEKIEARFSTVTLEDAQGTQQALGAPASSPDDAHVLDVDVGGALADGRYTVKCRVLSQDGHVIERSFSFTVKAPPANPTSP